MRSLRALAGSLSVVGIAGLIACSNGDADQSTPVTTPQPDGGGMNADASLTSPDAGPTSAPLDSGSADSGPSTPPMQATPLAEQLFTHPTKALIDEAASDHTPTAREKALVVVYWAMLAGAQQSGTFDPTLLQAGLQDRVLALAAKYPHFYTAMGADGGAPFVPLDLTTYTCTTSCSPSWSTIGMIGADLGGFISGLTTAASAGTTSTPSTFLDIAKPIVGQVISAIQIGTSLDTALDDLSEGDVGAALDAVASQTLTIAALVAASPEEVGAVAVLSATFAAVQLVSQLSTAVSDATACLSWKSSNCTTCSLAPGGTFACSAPSAGHCGDDRYGCCSADATFCDDAPAAWSSACLAAGLDCSTLTSCAAVTDRTDTGIISGSFMCETGETPHCGTNSAECCTTDYPTFCDSSPLSWPTGCLEANADCTTLTACPSRALGSDTANGGIVDGYFMCESGDTPYCGKTWGACCGGDYANFCDNSPSAVGAACWSGAVGEVDCSTIDQCADGSWKGCDYGGVLDTDACDCVDPDSGDDEGPQLRQAKAVHKTPARPAPPAR